GGAGRIRHGADPSGPSVRAGGSGRFRAAGTARGAGVLVPSGVVNGRPALTPVTRLQLAIATMAGVGYASFASGTWGTLATIPIYVALAWTGSTVLYLAATVALTLISIWACNACEPYYARKDPGEAVADEMCGFLVTMAFAPLNAWTIAAGFFIFRALDIV